MVGIICRKVFAVYLVAAFLAASRCTGGFQPTVMSFARSGINGGKRQEVITLLDSDDDAPASRTALKSANDGGAASFVPFHLLSTTSAKRLRSNDATKKYFRTLRELIGLGGANKGTTRRGQWLIIFNFLIDFSYLLEKLLPDVLSFHRVVVFYGEATGTEAMDQWKQLIAGTGNTVEFIRLVPSDPPRSRTNPLPIKIPYGVHHTKCFLVGYEEGNKSFCRVVVHTSNLLIGDCEYKTQGAYCQDFPVKESCNSRNSKKPAVVNPYKRQRQETNGAAKSSGWPFDEEDVPFEEDLITYLESYQYRTRQSWCKSSNTLSNKPMSWLQLVRQYDFSRAYAVLIPSVPGRHKDNDYHNFGYLKLRQAVIEWVCPRHQNDKQQSPPPIICQFSSIGSLNEKWLNSFLSAIDYSSARDIDPIKNASKKGKDAKDKPPPLSSRMKIVWPTMEEIRTSVEGYQGGGSVPGKVANLSKEFLLPLFHRWASRSDPLKTARHVPHVKTFVQPSASNGNGIEWLVLTSHNLSIAAWGQIQIRSEQSRSDEKILFIRHWELGVFMSPATLAKMAPEEVGDAITLAAYPDMLPTGDGSGVINLDSDDDDEDETSPKAIAPLPFDINPIPYNNSDVAWATDQRSPVPDSFGCVMGR